MAIQLIDGYVYLIGTGEVAKAALNKMLQIYPDQKITVLASNRTGGLGILSADSKYPESVNFHQVDILNDTDSLRTLIIEDAKGHGGSTIFNLGSPYLDIVLMETALATGCHYLDTACYEELDTKGFSYEAQLSMFDRFEECGLKALLGAGGSPGVTNVLTRFHNEARPVETVSIFDYNGGSQTKYPWSTNFSPEDNLKELDNPAKYLRRGQWETVPAFSERFHLDDVLMDGDSAAHFCTIFHEEQETIHRSFPEIKNIYSYMSFGEDYIKYFKLMRDIGLLEVSPVPDGQGGEIIPIRFLASLMPHPRETASITTGPAGMRVETVAKDDNTLNPLLTSVWRMTHEGCYKDTKTGAVAWSTGVPACLFLEALLAGTTPGVYVPETLPNLTKQVFFGLCNVYDLKISTFNGNCGFVLL